MTESQLAAPPSMNGNTISTERVPREQYNAVRERLRVMRTEDADLTIDGARCILEGEFGGSLSPTGFYATFWVKADPDDAEELDEVEEVEVEDEVDELDDDEDEAVEEEELTAELQVIIHEDGLRVVFDRVLPAASAYAMVRAIAAQLALEEHA